jgi:hypothetical protein
VSASLSSRYYIGSWFCKKLFDFIVFTILKVREPKLKKKKHKRKHPYYIKKICPLRFFANFYLGVFVKVLFSPFNLGIKCFIPNFILFLSRSIVWEMRENVAEKKINERALLVGQDSNHEKKNCVNELLSIRVLLRYSLTFVLRKESRSRVGKCF